MQAYQRKTEKFFVSEGSNYVKRAQFYKALLGAYLGAAPNS